MGERLFISTEFAGFTLSRHIAYYSWKDRLSLCVVDFPAILAGPRGIYPRVSVLAFYSRDLANCFSGGVDCVLESPALREGPMGMGVTKSTPGYISVPSIPGN